MLFLTWLYALTLLGLAVFGFHLLLLFLLAAIEWMRRFRRFSLPRHLSSTDERALADFSVSSVPSVDRPWPAVLVQLPIYNERYVVERLIDAAAALDYPPHRLAVQVLDDSTDDTVSIARARAAFHRARGRNVTYHHRADRAGFKAGALAEGLARSTDAADSPGSSADKQDQLIAVFDADFVPPPDFLRRVIPAFWADARLGMLQARWEHLNPDQNLLTRAQALGADGYFLVDQVARSSAGLLMNFNGSAGVWRRACIDDAGGWQGDTLAEDLDLSYRAQLNGWRLAYCPDLAVPAELPPTIAALKNQQFRWAKGSFQVLRKLGPRLFAARMPLYRKVLGFLHLGGFFVQPLALLALLLSLPVVLMRGQTPLELGWLSLATLGPLLTGLWGQLALALTPELKLRPETSKPDKSGCASHPQSAFSTADFIPRLARLRCYPLLVMAGTGLALTCTKAMWEAFFGREHEFKRTPKNLPPASGRQEAAYALSIDWTTWGELLLALYALAVALLALDLAPGLAPFIFLYALGFGYTGGLGLWESGHLTGVRTPVRCRRREANRNLP